MRAELKAALQARWQDSLRQRAALSSFSAVPLLNRLLASVRPASKPARSHLAPKIGQRGGAIKTTGPKKLCDLRMS